MRSLFYLLYFGGDGGEENYKKKRGHNIDSRCGPEMVQDMRHNPQSAFWELMLRGGGEVTVWSA